MPLSLSLVCCCLIITISSMLYKVDCSYRRRNLLNFSLSMPGYIKESINLSTHFTSLRRRKAVRSRLLPEPAVPSRTRKTPGEQIVLDDWAFERHFICKVVKEKIESRRVWTIRWAILVPRLLGHKNIREKQFVYRTAIPIKWEKIVCLAFPPLLFWPSSLLYLSVLHPAPFINSCYYLLNISGICSDVNK